MSTFRASAASLSPPPPSKKPGASGGGSGRTQAWEGHARATHCRRPPSHAQPGAYLGRTRPPHPAPHQCPPPAKSSAPAFHPQGPSILPESRRPHPVPYLTARSSPLSLHPCTHPSPGHAARPGDLRRACVCEHSRAPVRARRWRVEGGWRGRRLHAPVRASERAPRCCAPSRRRERAGLLCSPTNRWAGSGR